MKAFLFFVSFALSTQLLAQIKQAQSDWQQICDYTIQVELNDVEHTLSGNISLDYTNNSPQTLNKMYFHLWPNAYSSNNSAFARQQLGNGKSEFEFSKAEERGWIKGIDFEVEGKSCVWEFDSQNVDIAILRLNQPLKTGEKINITTPFKVKIPGRFSRFGHKGENYQITQWYPKPAVYDVNGWNPMPYLDQGEFYSEFGNFNVSITLPSNYIVAATGELQNESEQQFLLNRINNPIDPEKDIASTKEKKTLNYVQDNIHDFAWFASKNFNVETKTIESEGQEVTLYGFAALTDFNYTKDIAKGIEYYSEHIGPYPYKYCSAVRGALEAGGGMEYPMVTVLSVTQQEVIIHEVGHNWFYGILANNERRYPWMDESFNSYFDHEATRLKILNSDANLKRPRIANHLFDINDFIMLIMANYSEQLESHQAIGLHSAEFTEMNYGTMVYGKGAAIFQHLREYLGDSTMTACFHAYYDQWKFRHPLPKDAQRSFEKVSGKDLSWFFGDLVNSTGHLDYKMESLEGNRLTVINNGDINAPFNVGLFMEGELVHNQWIEPSEKETIEVIIPAGIDFDIAKIDPYEHMQESVRENNSIKNGGVFPKMEYLSFDYLVGITNPNSTQIFWSPIIGWNIHDKWMPGLYLSNFSFPGKKWNYRLMPMYSTNAETLTGFGKLSFNNYQNSKLWKSSYGVQAARFGFERFNPYSYTRVKPFMEFNFRPENLRSKKYSKLELDAVLVDFEPRYDVDESVSNITNDITGRREYLELGNDVFANLAFESGNDRVIDPFSTKIQLRYGSVRQTSTQRDLVSNSNITSDVEDQFLQLEIEHKRTISYNIPGKGLDVRLYAGYFLDEADNGIYHFRLGSEGGKYDYTFDRTLMGRGANEGLFNHQVLISGAQTKLTGNLGNINSWVAALNVSADLPWKGPLKIYADLFTFNDIDQFPNNTNGDKFGYSGGLSLELIPSVFEIFIPLVNSTFIEDSQKSLGYGGFADKISFRFNMNLLSPEELVEFLKM